MAYVGEFRDRLRDGHRAYAFPSGSFHYEGDWTCGSMHGQGVFSLPDGGSYEGEFASGEIDGIGLRRWPDGSTYNGQFHLGERHGEGVLIASSGEVYEGHWANNQRHGLGELRMVNGDVYRGDFHHHKPHGNGRIRFATDASIYDGDWVDGKISGRGVRKDGQGRQLYDGEWVNGQRCGHGIGLLSASVSSHIVFDGVWMDDKPIVPTTKLAFKIVVRPSAEEPTPTNDLDFQDVSGMITLDKKAQIPRLAVISLHESALESTPSIVHGESGRLLRLRVFKGQISAPVQSAGDGTGPSEAITPPSQWHFALVVESPPTDDQDDQVPNLESSTPNEDESEVTTPAEQQISELIVSNNAGISVFEKLALPTATPIGTYHLVCDSIDSGDDLVPIFMTLQVVE